MTRFDPRTLAPAIRRVLGALWRILPRLILLGVLLVAASVTIVVVMARLATPALQQTLADMAFDGTLVRQMLMQTVLWGALPVAALLCAGVIYLAATFLLADAALSGTRPFTLRTLAQAVRQLGHGLLVVLAVIAGIVPLFFLAVRWALALPEVFVRGVSARQALRESWRLTRGRTLQTYLVLGTTLIVVLSLGYGIPQLAGILPWEHATVVAQAVLSTLLAPVPAIMLVILWRSFTDDTPRPAPEAVEAGFVARRFGTSLPATLSVALTISLLSGVSPASAMEPGSVAEPVTEVATVSEAEDADVPPGASEVSETETEPEAASASASASDEGVEPGSDSDTETAYVLPLSISAPTTNVFSTGGDTRLPVTSLDVVLSGFHDPNGGLGWTYGEGTDNVSGTIQVPAGHPLDGTLQLWVRPEGGVDTPLGAPAPLTVPIEAPEHGWALLDGGLLGVGSYRVWVEYSGNEHFAPARSSEQRAIVYKPWHQAQLTFTSANDPIIVGDLITVTAIVTAPDASGEIGGVVTPHEGVNGPFQIVSTADNKVLADGTFVKGLGTAEFVMAARTLQIAVRAEGAEDYHLGSGEHVIHAQQTASQTTLSAPAQGVLGTPLALTAEVRGPAALTGQGRVRWEARTPGAAAAVDIGATPLNQDGLATIQLCVDSADASDAGCASANIVLPAGSGDVEVRARFEPSGEVDRQPLAASDSAWHTVAFTESDNGGTDPGAQECRLVEIRPRAFGNIQATEAEAATLGDARLDTFANCSGLHWWDDTPIRGYRDGTLLTVQARPAPGLELVEWRYEGETIGTAPTLTWRLPSSASPTTAWIEPVYRPICVSTSVNVNGHGTAYVLARGSGHVRADLFRYADCQLRDGTWGAYLGATVEVSARAGMNPATGENDTIYAARIGGQATSWQTAYYDDSHRFTYIVRQGLRTAVTFGPICRSVEAPGSRILTSPDCASPAGSGYTRASEVEVEIDLDALEEYQIPASWQLDGTDVGPVDESANGTFEVQAGDITRIAFDTIGCFPVEATVNEARASWYHSSGSQVTIMPAPNCGAEGDRWREGTTLTLSPVPGSSPSEGIASFSAWRDIHADGTERVTAAGNGDWSADRRAAGEVDTRGHRTLTIAAPLRTEASFYFPHACSTIEVFGRMSLNDLDIPDTGCGLGRYFDASKFAFPPDGLDDYGQRITRAMFDADTVFFPENTLTFSAPHSPTALQGTVQMRQVSINVPRGFTWTKTADLHCAGTECTAEVRGDLILRIQQCVEIDWRVNIRIADDDSGTVYSPEDFGLEDYPWLTSRNDGCPTSAEQWLAGSTIPVEPQSPAIGFVFEGWGETEGLVRTDEISRCDNRFGCYTHEIETIPRAFVRLPADRPTHPVAANFTLHCSHPGIAWELAIVQPAPNCPGATDENPLYVNGTVLHLVAHAKNHSGRDFVEFRGTVLPDTYGLVTERAADFAHIPNPGFLDWRPDTALSYASILAIADDDLSVWGWYQFPKSGWEKFVDTMAKVGKFTVGAVAVVSTALVTLCTPCSAALAVITVAEVLLRVFGVDSVANVLAMLNPLYMMECISRWGFESLPPVTDRQATTAEGVKSGGAIVAGAGAKGAKTLFANNKAMLGRIDDLSSSAKITGAVTQVALSVYTQEIYKFSFTGANEADLRDTAAFFACVTNTYKAP